MKKILFLLLCMIGTLNITDAEIEKIVNIDDTTKIKEKLRENKVVFYNEKNNQGNDDVCLYSTYYYKENNKIKCGYLYGNKDLSSKNIIKKKISIYKEIDSISNDMVIKRTSNNLDWVVDVDYRWSMTVEYQNAIIADYTEYVTSGYYNTPNYAYRYFEYRGFVSPTKDDDDVRTQSLEFRFEPGDNSNNWELYDYSPKKRGTSREITYGFSGQIGADESEGFSANLGMSKSWNAIEESPTIHDYGNMSQNTGDIKFEYVNCTDNSGAFFDYSREQTNQNCMFVFRNNISNSKTISILDTRTLVMLYDHTWPKANQHPNKAYTVNRLFEYR